MGVVQFAITTLVTFIWPLFVPAQKIPTSEPGSEEATRLVGRVLAWQETFALGASLGPKYQVFVFAVGRDRGEPVTPIKVAYAFSSLTDCCRTAFSITRSSMSYKLFVTPGATKA
jgi:hypothetical protein